MRWVALLLLLPAPGRADPGAAEVRLGVIPPRESVTLLLGAPPAARVSEEREVSLPAGTATLDLDWGGTRLVADSLEVSPADGVSGLKVSGPTFPADLPQRARWVVETQQAQRARLRLAYLLEGLTWEAEYNAVLGSNGKLSLMAVAALRNDSGEDFEGARVDLGLSAPVTADVKNGETLRIPYVEAASVQGEVFTLYDAAGNGDPESRLRLWNTRENGLGAAPLPAGKLRFYSGDEGRRLLTGEANLPYTAVGQKTEVRLGSAREISVERRVIASKQLNQKLDARGRLALWDQEDEVAFLVKSQKNEDTRLRISERIEGEWRMLANSHEFERKDAERVEFIVPVPAHGELTVTYRVRRTNLLP